MKNTESKDNTLTSYIDETGRYARITTFKLLIVYPTVYTCFQELHQRNYGKLKTYTCIAFISKAQFHRS